ncbi:hypothetical protein BC739_007619 [Kutzneria viridogrisea]|uniref:Uncharacterized protein n=1 Tax=Kutzneria viridogrisea TaxID=47990 RepID=A0ABR6BTY5_9PSEU|nr:hypothetical protein [Kutzneria viridogrisea]
MLIPVRIAWRGILCGKGIPCIVTGDTACLS